ncbi:MAG: hypothetical protein N4A40_11925 [Tissierellales bacterium]|jgi:hypothetical protein|nr:hypothetical protein [Tissierellales bacterium]
MIDKIISFSRVLSKVFQFNPIVFGRTDEIFEIRILIDIYTMEKLILKKTR